MEEEKLSEFIVSQPGFNLAVPVFLYTAIS